MLLMDHAAPRPSADRRPSRRSRQMDCLKSARPFLSPRAPGPRDVRKQPDPAVYEHLVARVRAEKEMVWLISSNPFDVIGAKACGLRTVWVRRDPSKAFDPWEFEPDLVVPGLAQLPGKPNFT